MLESAFVLECWSACVLEGWSVLCSKVGPYLYLSVGLYIVLEDWSVCFSCAQSHGFQFVDHVRMCVCVCTMYNVQYTCRLVGTAILFPTLSGVPCNDRYILEVLNGKDGSTNHVSWGGRRITYSRSRSRDPFRLILKQARLNYLRTLNTGRATHPSFLPGHRGYWETRF